MADSKAKEIFMGVGEVIAAHQLLKFVPQSTKEERLRMATGAGMAALGYIYGPELEQRLRHHDSYLSTTMQRHLMHAAGGALLGAFLGYQIGPKFGSNTTPQLASTFDIAAIQATQDPKRPGGLLTVASGAYLAYALLLNGKSIEQRKQHSMMLGAGALGYIFGPEVMQRAKTMTISVAARDDALDRYAKAGALLGGVGGGLLGFYRGDIVQNWLTPHLPTLDDEK